jgi:hypothetical protein
MNSHIIPAVVVFVGIAKTLEKRIYYSMMPMPAPMVLQ